MSVPQTVLDIAEICVRQGVKHLVMSPGSRNAPLTLAFNRHPEVVSKLVADERSAAYIALGMAQSLGQPVMLLCTSGTAAMNFGPGIAEAFYQQVPLLVFTADRPPEWIDQHDGQAIRQREIFRNHTKKNFQLPVSLDHADAKWHVLRTINEAINITRSDVPGPVHVNVPFREPFYPKSGQAWNYSKKVPLIALTDSRPGLTESSWNQLAEQWSKASKILIVGGQGRCAPEMVAALNTIQKNATIPVIGDAITNLHQVNHIINHPEIIFGMSAELLETLRPDLLITFGGSVISKNMKLFLRDHPPAMHWHLQPAGYPADTFKSLSEVITMHPSDFINQLTARVPKYENPDWYSLWQVTEERAKSIPTKFLDKQEFNELQAVARVIAGASGAHLHLANSTPVRWVDLLGVPPEIKQVSANRGTSGIDGCSSAAVGHALVNQEDHLLISGDMAFFYDRNAFWHNYQLPNLKIVVLNNHGGGIFRLIDGPRDLPELESLFVAKQNWSCRPAADGFGMKYLYCNNAGDLDQMIQDLMELKDQTGLLEIEVPENMGSIYQDLKASIKSYE